MTPGLVGILGLARSGRGAARWRWPRAAPSSPPTRATDELVREAAAEIRRLGGEAETGGHTVERLAECDLLVVSPGIPPDAPVLRDERLRHVPWTSELEFAFRALCARPSSPSRARTGRPR
jgi:UDP-N-acetylmuramoylalanine--D-glutamate ligase